MLYVKVAFDTVNGIFGDVYFWIDREDNIYYMLKQIFKAEIESYSYVVLQTKSQY